MIIPIEQFKAAVWRCLPVVTDQLDVECTNRCIEQYHEQGWTIADTADFCRCLEHVNPELDEDVALNRMSRIIDRVKGYTVKPI